MKNKPGNTYIKELEAQYTEQANKRKSVIRSEPNKFKRFWKWVLYLLTYPFVWAWYNFRDWRTFLIFIIVMLVVGIEVWLPFLLGLIFNNAWLLGIAATCEAFWLLPGTPFLPLCIFITIVIKSFINRKEHKRMTNLTKVYDTINGKYFFDTDAVIDINDLTLTDTVVNGYTKATTKTGETVYIRKETR